MGKDMGSVFSYSTPPQMLQHKFNHAIDSLFPIKIDKDTMGENKTINNLVKSAKITLSAKDPIFPRCRHVNFQLIELDYLLK